MVKNQSCQWEANAGVCNLTTAPVPRPAMSPRDNVLGRATTSHSLLKELQQNTGKYMSKPIRPIRSISPLKLGIRPHAGGARPALPCEGSRPSASVPLVPILNPPKKLHQPSPCLPLHHHTPTTLPRFRIRISITDAYIVPAACLLPLPSRRGDPLAQQLVTPSTRAIDVKASPIPTGSEPLYIATHLSHSDVAT